MIWIFGRSWTSKLDHVKITYIVCKCVRMTTACFSLIHLQSLIQTLFISHFDEKSSVYHIVIPCILFIYLLFLYYLFDLYDGYGAIYVPSWICYHIGKCDVSYLVFVWLPNKFPNSVLYFTYAQLIISAVRDVNNWSHFSNNSDFLVQILTQYSMSLKERE